MEMQSMQRGAFRLAGIRVEGEFPGFDRKAAWLKEAFAELDKRTDGLPGFARGTRYFIYHSKPWEGFAVCMEVEGDARVPSGMVVVPAPDVRYDVCTYSGPLAEQQQAFDAVCATHNGAQPDEDIVHFERYDDRFDFDTNSGTIDICIPVKPIVLRNLVYGRRMPEDSHAGG